MSTIFCPHCKLPMTELESRGGVCPACDGSLRPPEPEPAKAVALPPARSGALPWIAGLLAVSLLFNGLWLLPRNVAGPPAENNAPVVVAQITPPVKLSPTTKKSPGLPYFDVLPMPKRADEPEEKIEVKAEPKVAAKVEPKVEAVKVPEPKADPRPAGNLVVGKDGLAMNGQVQAGDPKFRVSSGIFSSVDFPSKMYTVDFAAGRRYRIKMETAGEALVSVRNKAGRTLATEKAAAGVVDFPIDILADGPHRVVVAQSKPGKHALSIREDEALVVHDAGQDLKFSGEIGKAATVTYMVKVTAGKNYVIDMISPNTAALDPLIRLFDADGVQLAQDDDGAGNLNARLAWKAPATGIYRVVATRYQGRGPYTLTVRQK